MATHECDLLIIGAGPAGLSAAINGASEGLKVILIDSGPNLGGQAAQSSLIENYPGFPEGISGAEMIKRFIDQALKFNTSIQYPQVANSLRAEGDKRIVTTKCGETYIARMVILSGGLSYRRLEAPGVKDLLGRGVYYGAPTLDLQSMGSSDVCIVGGANSAGQAAMHLSKNPEARITILVRKSIAAQMSTYLLDRIVACPTITVLEGVEVAQAHGTDLLERISVKHESGTIDDLPANHLFIFIGALPKVEWLQGSIAMDSRGFILAGGALGEQWTLERPPLSFETSMPGVMVCGDVRGGSTKRIASAVGEGSVGLQACHDYARLLAGG